MPTARLMTFCKSCEYALAPVNIPLLLLLLELEELLDELLLERLELELRLLLPDKALLIVPINRLQGRIEQIVLSGPKL